MQVGPIAACLAKVLPRLRPARRDLLLTALLLLGIDDRRLRTHCLDSLTRGAARIDEDLVLGLYSAGGKEAKLAIARSIVTSRLRPRAFRKIFHPMYARSDLSAQQRWELAWNLEHFLHLNPRQGPAYARMVLDLTQSRHLDLKIRGLSMAAQFERIDASLLTLFTRGFRSRSPRIRLASVNAFSHLVERLDELPSDIREVITSETFRRMVTLIRRADPDEDVRAGTGNLLKRLRRSPPSKRPANHARSGQ